MTDTNLRSLQDIEDALQDAANSLPPVQSWNPERSGQIDIQIKRDGSWWHEGGEIKRLELVRLFSGILRAEDNAFWLVTPVEKLKIQVDDAPFVVSNLEVLIDEHQGQILVFRTNVGDKVILGENNPLHVELDPQSGEPSPYVHVRHGLLALISRSVYYQLVELGRVEEDKLLVTSVGQNFSLGSILDL